MSSGNCISKTWGQVLSSGNSTTKAWEDSRGAIRLASDCPRRAQKHDLVKWEVVKWEVRTSHLTTHIATRVAQVGAYCPCFAPSASLRQPTLRQHRWRARRCKRRDEWLRRSVPMQKGCGAGHRARCARASARASPKHALQLSEPHCNQLGLFPSRLLQFPCAPVALRESINADAPRIGRPQVQSPKLSSQPTCCRVVVFHVDPRSHLVAAPAAEQM